jgi:hypothetical protein
MTLRDPDQDSTVKDKAAIEQKKADKERLEKVREGLGLPQAGSELRPAGDPPEEKPAPDDDDD